uniref:Serpentine receptor class gamma n=2 Tax=Steinernema glaseri TaxID=37863 RepID=A0A1I7ZQI2_9BILA
MMPERYGADDMDGVKYERQSFATLKSAQFDLPLYDKAFSLRLLAYFGAFLPGLGCFTCIAYTYIFQADRVLNFTTSSCPDVYVAFPPVSYSIGVWDPQKYFWLFVMFFHMPPRIFYPYFYKKMFISLKPEVASERWFQAVLWWYMRTMYIEPLGLIAVTVFDMEKVFELHALSYTVWIVAFNFNMLFTVILQDFSGARELSPMHNRTWLLKRFLLIAGIALSCTSGVSYGIYTFWCIGEAYAVFTIVEYVLVGFNSLFHFLILFDFSNVKMEMRYDLEMVGREKSNKFKNVDITVFPEQQKPQPC